MIPDENGELQEAEKIQLESMCPECEKFNHVRFHFVTQNHHSEAEKSILRVELEIVSF